MPSAAQAKAAWTKVAFGDVVRLAKDRSRDPLAEGIERFVGLEHLEPGQLRIRDWGLVADGTTFTNRFRPRQVLFGKRRAYQRKVAVADFEGVCSSDIYVLESRDDRLLPEFLPYICQTDAFFEHAVGTSAGSLSPRTNWKSLASFEFALPPVEEQRRIVSACQSVDRVIGAFVAAAARARSTAAAAFEQCIANFRYSEIRLGDVLVASPRNGFSSVPASTETGHWVLALSAITPWGYRAGELKPVPQSREMDRARLRAGDLIVSRSNTRELVGLPAIFPDDRDDVSYPDTMMRLEIDTDRFQPEFIAECLRSKHGRRQIQSLAAGTSASMKKISGSNLRRVRIPEADRQAQRVALERSGSLAAAAASLGCRAERAAAFRKRLLTRALDPQPGT